MIERLYQRIILEHFRRNRQMLFLSGPRQVGKTTSSLSAAPPEKYLNWDNEAHRMLILAGPESVARHFELSHLQTPLPIVVFDEIHKYRHWKRNPMVNSPMKKKLKSMILRPIKHGKKRAIVLTDRMRKIALKTFEKVKRKYSRLFRKLADR